MRIWIFLILILKGQKGGGKEEREIRRKQNQDGLTTSVHSHCSMSSMTEDW